MRYKVCHQAHNAKVVLGLTAAKSPQRLTRHLATPPAVSSFGGFWDAGPGVRRATFMGPASANLHITGSQMIYRSLRRRILARQSISAL